MPLAPDEEMSDSHQFCWSFLVSGSFGGGPHLPLRLGEYLTAGLLVVSLLGREGYHPWGDLHLQKRSAQINIDIL